MTNQQNVVVTQQPSVLRGDVPVIAFNLPTKSGEVVNVGNIWCKGGVFTFDGSVDLSGKAIFDEITKIMSHVLQIERGSNNG